MFNKEQPKCVGSVFKLLNKLNRETLLQKFKLHKDDYLVFNAGSGGHKIGEVFASDIFFETAKMISKKHDFNCLVLFGDNYPKKLPENGNNQNLYCLQSVDNAQFIALLLDAKGVMIGGGDTLLQVVELGVKCVVSAVSKDQPKRITQCRSANNVYQSNLTVEDQVDKIEFMLNAIKDNQEMNGNIRSQALTTILRDIKALLALN